jgi:hypothetical protein
LRMERCGGHGNQQSKQEQALGAKRSHEKNLLVLSSLLR